MRPGHSSAKDREGSAEMWRGKWLMISSSPLSSDPSTFLNLDSKDYRVDFRHVSLGSLRLELSATCALAGTSKCHARKYSSSLVVIGEQDLRLS